MSYQVFISHSTRNADVASSMKSFLDAQGIRCWKAPEDIPAGVDWDTGIVNGLKECSVIVLIFSKDADGSANVKTELALGSNFNKVIVPFRIEDNLPETLTYFLCMPQWLDAFESLEAGFNQLSTRLKALLPAINNKKEIPTIQTTKPEVTTKQKDTTRYNFNGITLGKGRLVLEVIRRHCLGNPSISYGELETAFPQSLQGSGGVFARAEDANKILSETGRKRHFLNEDELIRISDATIVVSSQWGAGNIDKFVERARANGYEIEVGS
jgi:hypothetical protein